MPYYTLILFYVLPCYLCHILRIKILDWYNYSYSSESIRLLIKYSNIIEFLKSTNYFYISSLTPALNIVILFHIGKCYYDIKRR